MSGISNLVGKAHRELLPKWTRTQVLAVVALEEHAAEFQVEQSSWHAFFKGTLRPKGDISEWYMRARLCLRAILNVAAGDDPHENSSMERVLEFFLPDCGIEAIQTFVDQRDFYFNSAHYSCSMPVTMAEVEQEIRAMLYIRRKNREADCRVIRASGFGEFSTIHFGLQRLTAASLLEGVYTAFLHRETGTGVNLAKSSAELVRDAVYKINRERLAENGEAETTSVEPLGNRIHIIPVVQSIVTAADGRPMDYLSSSLFRWAYYRAPRAVNDNQMVHSLVVTRVLDRENPIPFCFIPTEAEAKDFSAWAEAHIENHDQQQV